VNKTGLCSLLIVKYFLISLFQREVLNNLCPLYANYSVLSAYLLNEQPFIILWFWKVNSCLTLYFMQKKKLLNVVAAGLFLVALIWWFAVPAIARTQPEVSYTFLDLAFGRTETLLGVLGVEVIIFKFSFLNFLVLLLLLAGVGLSVGRLVVKSLEKNKLLGFVILALGLVSVVLLALLKNFAVMPNVDEPAKALEAYKLTGGAVVALVLAGLGGVAGVAADLLK